MESKRFKARGELLTFAASHPGALSGYFLAMVHQKLCHGVLKETKDLRKVNVCQWVSGHSGLTEVRNLREANTLAYVVDLINSRDLAMALNVLSQRLVPFKRKAQAWKNSWSSPRWACPRCPLECYA